MIDCKKCKHLGIDRYKNDKPICKILSDNKNHDCSDFKLKFWDLVKSWLKF